MGLVEVIVRRGVKEHEKPFGILSSNIITSLQRLWTGKNTIIIILFAPHLHARAIHSWFQIKRKCPQNQIPIRSITSPHTDPPHPSHSPPWYTPPPHSPPSAAP